MEELKKSLEGEDAEEVKAKTEALMQASMKLGEAIYKAQQEADAAEAEGEAAPASEDDNVVDADFEEVKEDEDDDKKKEA